MPNGETRKKTKEKTTNKTTNKAVLLLEESKATTYEETYYRFVCFFSCIRHDLSITYYVKYIFGGMIPRTTVLFKQTPK